MLLQIENWETAYEQLKTDCRSSTSSSSGTVLILCNPDADALCAARILRCIFVADKIPFQLRPCGGMGTLVSTLESLNLYDEFGENGNSGNGDFDGYGGDGDGDGYTARSSGIYNVKSPSSSSIRLVILLNFGATKNLNKVLYSPRPIQERSSKPPSMNHTNKSSNDFNNHLDDENNIHNNQDEEENPITFKPPLISRHIKTFVLDSHRPYHLANIHAGKNIVLWNDYDTWHADEGGIPSDGEGLSGDDDDDDDSSDEEDDDSDEEESDGSDNDSDEGEAEFEDEDDINVNDEEESSPVGREDDEDVDEDVDEHKNEESKGNRSLKRTSSTSSSIENNNGDTDFESSSPMPNKRQRQDDPDTPATEVMTDDENNQTHETIQSQEKEDSQDEYEGTSNENMLTMREQFQMRRDRIRNYYNNGSFYSSPVSFMAYILSTKLRLGSVGDLLWLACIGVTDAYIHNRLELSGYIATAMELKKRITNMYAESDYLYQGDNENDMMNQHVQNIFHAEELYTRSDLYGEGGGDGSGSVSGANYNGPMTRVGFSDNGRIIAQNDEFRFFLLRHVSLWDAIVLSPEINTKMKLWKNEGIKRLQEMLAKMGVPLDECQQPYAFMRPTLKRRLKSVMEEHTKEYGLDNLKYTAFLRVTGYKSLLSASDVAYAVTALLECDTEAKGSNINSRAGIELNTDDEDERKLVSSFNTAYDALNPNANVDTSGLPNRGLGEGSDFSSLVNGSELGAGASGIGGGIRLAFSLQTAIVNAAMGLVERKAIIRLSHFRYAYLHATSQGANRGSRFKTSSSSRQKATNKSYNHHIFAKPLALTKLAIFLMDMHRVNRSWTGKKARPLLLLAEKPQTQTYLVVGFEFPEERGIIKKNKFREKFKMVTETMQGSFKYDSFESNVVEVSSNDVQKFIEHLHYMIDAIE